MSDLGKLSEVVAEPRGSFLTADADVSDTELLVDDAGDFDDAGGALDLNGTQLAYTGITFGEVRGDPDTIHLAEPLTSAATTDDTVSAVIAGQVAVDYWASVDMDEGGSVKVPLRYDQLNGWPVRVYDPPVPVAVAEDLSGVEDAPGRQRSLGRSEAWNLDQAAALADDADVEIPLTYVPFPRSIKVEQNGLSLLTGEWAWDGAHTLTVAPSANLVIRTGDVFQAYYDHDEAADATQGVPETNSSYDAAVLAEPTLLGYWRLAESSGLVMEDSSGHGRHGTYSPGVELGTAALLVDDPDTSAHFPLDFQPRGVVPYGSWMNVSTFSAECWIATDALSGGIQYLVNRDTNARSWMMRADSGGNARAEIFGGGDSSGAADLDDTNVHFVAMTYDGTNIRLYVDGSLVQTTASSAPPSVAADLAIGGTYAGDSTWWHPYYFKGRMSKVAFYSGAQSDAQILNRWEIGSGA